MNKDMLNQIVCADSLKYLRSCESDSVHCMITSPPYYQLRDYGVAGQVGLESSLDEFIEKLVLIFREARRVLHPTGTLWVNMGDSYVTAASEHKIIGGQGHNSIISTGTYASVPHTGRKQRVKSFIKSGLKPKDLVGQPWRLAFALQSDGWYLRSDIIWHKSNPMPESVTDRPTNAHEHVFLLAKSPHYYYDSIAIKQPAAASTIGRGPVHFGGEKGRNYNPSPGDPNYRNGKEQWGRVYEYPGGMVNKRSVWTVATQPFKDAHFATFPEALIEPMILAGCSPKVCPTCLSPWRRVTEKEFIPQVVLN